MKKGDYYRVLDTLLPAHAAIQHSPWAAIRFYILHMSVRQIAGCHAVSAQGRLVLYHTGQDYAAASNSSAWRRPGR